MTYTVSSGTLNSTIPYLDLCHRITIADALFDRDDQGSVDRSVLDAAPVGSIVVFAAVRALRVHASCRLDS